MRKPDDDAELLEDYDDEDAELLDKMPREPALCPACARRPQERVSGLCSQCTSGRYRRTAKDSSDAPA